MRIGRDFHRKESTGRCQCNRGSPGPAGHPIKYEMDKEAGTLVVDRFLLYADDLSGQLRLRAAQRFSDDGDPIDG